MVPLDIRCCNIFYRHKGPIILKITPIYIYVYMCVCVYICGFVDSGFRVDYEEISLRFGGVGVVPWPKPSTTGLLLRSIF